MDVISLFKTIIAFFVALGVLVAIHEYGHFQVARWCGVKVLRFAIGFGKPLLRWRGKETEFALCLLPLGGYVKMLDEREGSVHPEERHLAFNVQPVWKRFLIVAAGPVANLLLAIAVYTGIAWYGVQQAQPIISEPVAGSLAAQAGLRSGDKVLGWRMASGKEWQKTVSLEQLAWSLTQAALDQRDVELLVQPSRTPRKLDALPSQQALHERTVLIPLHLIQLGQEAKEGLGHVIGIGSPWLPATVEQVLPGGPAAQAGLQGKDKILAINQQPVYDAAHLQSVIRQSTSGDSQQWLVDRSGKTLQLRITPTIETVGTQRFAKVGIQLGGMPDTVVVRYGFFDGLEQGIEKVWGLSVISLKGFAKMLTGELSVKNIGGPITIADLAGQSAQLGVVAYLGFLGLISVSLGVLNLMPVPVLDGGHLMYYLWEAATGRPVSEVWDQRFKQIGLVLLACMMAIAMFNDLSRHFR